MGVAMRRKNEDSAEEYFKDSWASVTPGRLFTPGSLEQNEVMGRRWQFLWDSYRDLAEPADKERLQEIASLAMIETAKGNMTGSLLTSTARFIIKYKMAELPDEFTNYCLQVFYWGVEQGITDWNVYGGKRLYKWGKAGPSSYMTPEEVGPATLGLWEKQKGVQRNREWLERVSPKP